MPRVKNPGGGAEESQIKSKSHLKYPTSAAHYSMRIDFGLWGQPVLQQPLTSSWLMRQLRRRGKGRRWLPRNSQEADAAGHRGYMKAPGGAHLAENAAEN